MNILLLLLALLLPPRPELTAHWVGPRSAELRWNVPGCLYRKPAGGGGVFLGCYDRAGAMRLPPGPPADAAYFPQVGDRYLLLADQGDVWAALEWWMWLPSVQNEAATPLFQTWLPMVG